MLLVWSNLKVMGGEEVAMGGVYLNVVIEERLRNQDVGEA